MTAAPATVEIILRDRVCVREREIQREASASDRPFAHTCITTQPSQAPKLDTKKVAGNYKECFFGFGFGRIGRFWGFVFIMR